ncbi:MAG: helix-turn-helix transcriptional regulator [Nitratireductor sp.]|nr:helix-turn-helix transcriptional regulator [Nitratireductor sp.]
MFSVTSNMDKENWRRKIDGEREMLIQIGDALHRKAVRQVFGTDEGPSLSAREIECLYWTARGKDSASAADIIQLSEHTVRDYLKSARSKLGCVTIAQAIHEATKLRLI